MRRPARFSTITVVVAVATALAIGGAVSSSVGGATALHGGLALTGGRAVVGGPTTQHTHVAARYLGPTDPYAGPTPDIACDQGSLPETVQGQAPKADYDSGRAARGYFCNARLVSLSGHTGGYRVERYADKGGHECAYW